MVLKTLSIALTILVFSLPVWGAQIIAVRITSVDHRDGSLRGLMVQTDGGGAVRETEAKTVTVRLEENAFVPGYVRPGRLIWLRGDFRGGDRDIFVSGDIVGCGPEGCDRTGVRKRIGWACRKGRLNHKNGLSGPDCRCGSDCRCDLPSRPSRKGPEGR